MSRPTQGKWVLLREGVEKDGGDEFPNHEIHARLADGNFVLIAECPIFGTFHECTDGADLTYELSAAEALANAQVVLAAPKLLAVCLELLASQAHLSGHPWGVIGRIKAAVELAGVTV